MYNPVYEAYEMLIAHRDGGEELDIDAVIGYLGEALDDCSEGGVEDGR